MQSSPPAIRALHIFVLSAFALAQPLFDVLARHPAFLVAHRADALDLVLLAFTLSFLIPAVVVAIQFGLQRMFRKAGG